MHQSQAHIARGHAQQVCMIHLATASDGIVSSGCGAQLHFTCTDCLRQYVSHELDVAEESDRRLEARRKRGGQLSCPGHAAGCQGHLADEDLERLLPWRLFERYRAAKKADEEYHRWQQSHRNETDPEILREGLLREMPNAKMCGRCQYGPIDHFACSELGSHHGEWNRGAQIRNECPKCHWWAWQSGDWPAWDGTLRLNI